MSSVTKAIIELHTLPNIAFCKVLMTHDELILETKENYNKRSFRNRFEIAGANGRLNISIPLAKGKHQQQPIKEVEISYDTNWRAIVWRSIQSAYGKSPYFIHYADIFHKIFEEHYESLVDLNNALLQGVINGLKINVLLSESDQYVKAYNSQEIADFRNVILPRKNGYFEHAEYEQAFEHRYGFQSNLSILDVLFNIGPETREIILGSRWT